MNKKIITEIFKESKNYSEFGEFEVWFKKDIVYDFIVSNGELKLCYEPFEGLDHSEVIVVNDLSSYIEEFYSDVNITTEFKYKIESRKLILS